MKFDTPEDQYRFAYRLRPYLRHVPRSILDERLNDVIRNVYGFTEEGKVGRAHNVEIAKIFHQLLTDAVVAFEERNIPLDAFGDSIDFARTPWRTDQVSFVNKNLHFQNLYGYTPAYFKFLDKVDFAERMLTRGEVFISPAALFSKDSLDYARQAYEMQVPQYISPYDFELQLIHKSLERLLPARSQIELSYFKPAPHFIYCVTSGFDFRYLVDFSKTKAFVVINNQKKFVRRLMEAARIQWPGFGLRFGMIKYFDPFKILFRPCFPVPHAYFIKNISYLYQAEHRLVVYPNDQRQIESTTWEPRALEIGSLEDIAGIFYVNQ